MKSSKLSAILAEIKARRAADIEAKFVIISQYVDVLQGLEAHLDPVRYTVDVQLTAARDLTVNSFVTFSRVPGDFVIESRRSITLTPDKQSFVLKPKTPNKIKLVDQPRSAIIGPPDNFYTKNPNKVFVIKKGVTIKHQDNTEYVVESIRDSEYLYTIKRQGTADRYVDVPRTDIVPASVRISGVRGSAMKPIDRESLSGGGSDNRFEPNQDVMIQRPPIQDESIPLKPLMRVSLRGTKQTNNPNLEISGRIEQVIRNGWTAPDGTVSDAYRVLIGQDGPALYPRSALRDLGSTSFHAGKIISIQGEPSESDNSPFANTIGYCVLNEATKRTAVLEMMKNDPMCCVALLTKEATGVGINIPFANHVILVEPFETSAAEAQGIARIHRIGQTRETHVLKFYTEKSIDERLLYLRKRRGQLYDAGPNSGAVGLATDDNAAASSGRSAQYSLSDYQVLYGTDLSA